MSGHKDHYRLLHVSSSIDGNINMWIDPKKKPPLKTWIKIRISQTLVKDKVLMLSILLNYASFISSLSMK